MSTAAVFLDRDNTIIHNDGDLGDPGLVRLIQGAASAIASLRGLNYRIVVVTNQGGVARGKYSEEDVEKTNQRVADLVKAASGASIDRFYYCPYHPNGTVERYKQEHDWRKPSPGMILQAARDMQIDLSRSWMIGDQMRDVQAGAAAGVRCILLRGDAQELQPLRHDQLKSGTIEVTGDIQHFTARNMVEAVRIIAKQRKPEAELPGPTGEPDRPRWDAAAVKAARQQRQAASSETASQTAEGTTAKGKPGTAGSSSAARPFRPWNASSQHEPKAAPAQNKIQGRPPEKAPEKPPEKSPEKPPAAVTEAATDDASAAEPVATGAAVSSRSATTAAQTMNDAAAASEKDRPAPSGDQTLRQILQELRSQRQVASDFSYLRMCSVVLLIVAVFLLLAGLLLGGESLESFVRWAATSIVLMLAAACLLLMER